MAKRGTCAICKREKMTIVARGMCGKCYQDFRKAKEPSALDEFIEGPSPGAEPVEEGSVNLRENIGHLQTGINALIDERNRLKEANKALRKELIEAVGQLHELKTLVEGNFTTEEMA
jgi:hypothetical protein